MSLCFLITIMKGTIDMNEKLLKLLGPIPTDNSPWKQRMRIHQGWWRTCVLGKKPGLHPIEKSQHICNTILLDENQFQNFLSSNIINVVKQELVERNKTSLGMIDENRLLTNLLSSQPLCFNFFGELAYNLEFATQILQRILPEVAKVRRIYFEYAPPVNYTCDNSAFDVAMEIESGNSVGLFGLECKYTDTFSAKNSTTGSYYGSKGSKHYEEYSAIFNQASDHFKDPYDKFVNSTKFNQLFRNELIAQAALQHDEYDFVRTGLFCHEGDTAVKIGKDFQEMLHHGEDTFIIITYQELIKIWQQLDISWEKRELSMLLWARYCGEPLSEFMDISYNKSIKNKS
jgi:hypothetical protein